MYLLAKKLFLERFWSIPNRLLVLVDCGTGINRPEAVYDLHPNTCRSFCCKEVAATVQPDGFTSKVGVLRGRQDHRPITRPGGLIQAAFLPRKSTQVTELIVHHPPWLGVAMGRGGWWHRFGGVAFGQDALRNPHLYQKYQKWFLLQIAWKIQHCTLITMKWLLVQSPGMLTLKTRPISFQAPSLGLPPVQEIDLDQ